MQETVQGSPRFTLSGHDLGRITLGAGVAAGGALLTYLAQVVTEIDFGVWTPVVVMGASVLVNMARKFLSDRSDTLTTKLDR
jgi:hypothetical protein